MRRIIMGTALALSLAVAGTAQANIVKSTSTGPWKASNSTVQKVTGGVHFGTYANGGALGGSLMYSGANGLRLLDVKDFSYTFNYRQAGNTTGAAPYARIFLDTDPRDGSNSVDTDVILDPSFCATVLPLQSTDLTYQMVGNSVRYNDDGCDGVAPDQQNWAKVVADHGDDVITNVLVSQGNSTGADVSAMVKRITFNGKIFDFTGAPADGHNGQNGTNGTNGANGVNGKDGVSIAQDASRCFDPHPARPEDPWHEVPQRQGHDGWQASERQGSHGHG